MCGRDPRPRSAGEGRHGPPRGRSYTNPNTNGKTTTTTDAHTA
jgi:hypothetical protein